MGGKKGNKGKSHKGKSNKGRSNKGTAQKAEKKASQALSMAKYVAKAAVGVPRIPKRMVATQKFKKVGGKLSKGRPGLIRVYGKCYVGTILYGQSNGIIQAGANNTKGTVLYQAAINPSYGPPKLRVQAQFYEKYIANKITFFVKGRAAASVAGGYIGTFDMDPADSLPLGIGGYVAQTNQKGSDGTWSNPNRAIRMTKRNFNTTQQGYYTNLTATSDPRLVNQATFQLAVEMPIKAEAGTVTWSNGDEIAELWTEYDFLLWGPTDEGGNTGSSLCAYYVPTASLSSLTAANPLTGAGGLAILDPQFDGLPISLTSSSGQWDQANFPAQWEAFWVRMFWTGTSIGTFAVSSANCTPLNDPNGGTYTGGSTNSLNTAATWSGLYYNNSPNILVPYLRFSFNSISSFSKAQLTATPVRIPTSNMRKNNALTMASLLAKMEQFQKFLPSYQRAIDIQQNQADLIDVDSKSKLTSVRPKERSEVSFIRDDDVKYNEQTLRNENVVRMAVGSPNGENKISQSSQSALGLLDTDHQEEYEVEELKREADQHGFVLIRRDQGLPSVSEREPERQQRTRISDDLVGIGEPVLRRKSVFEPGAGRSSSLK